MYGEITLKFSYPLNASNYSAVENEDYAAMLEQDVEELQNGVLTVEDLAEDSFVIVESKVIENPPVVEEVIELSAD